MIVIFRANSCVLLLDTLKHQNVPTILVASKCDLSTKRWSATSKKIDGIYKNNKSVNSLQTTLNSPETHKRCISIILSNIMLELHGKRHYLSDWT